MAFSPPRQSQDWIYLAPAVSDFFVQAASLPSQGPLGTEALLEICSAVRAIIPAAYISLLVGDERQSAEEGGVVENTDDVGRAQGLGELIAGVIESCVHARGGEGSNGCMTTALKAALEEVNPDNRLCVKRLAFSCSWLRCS